MKISTETLNFLKNFSNINGGILFKEGNEISTVSQQKNILAVAKVTEDIPKDFGIYDLNNFLSVVSLFKDGCELDFDDKHVIIKGMAGRSQIKYRITDPTMIYDAKGLDIIDNKKRPKVNSDVTFKLSQNDFNWIIRTANVLSSPNIAVNSNGINVSLVCYNASNDSAHTHSMVIEDVDPNGKEFNLIFKTENLKILPGTYDVEISSSGISKFTDMEKGISYWITLEMGSVYS